MITAEILKMIKRGEYKKKPTQYKHVDLLETKHGSIIRAQITKYKWVSFFTLEEERTAAVAVDKKLLEKGKEPCNILKRKAV